jgi:hypothetical protein
VVAHFHYIMVVGMVTAYFGGRHTKIVIGTTNTAILLTSSFLVAWAVSAAKFDMRGLPAGLLVVAAIFMELRENSGLIIAFAMAGFFWLGVRIWLTGADIITRPQFPPVMPQ